MKKIIPIALLMCVLMVASAWSISWFAQARSIRHWIEGGMAGLDPALGSLRAASVTTTGFPTKMIVTVTNPDLTLQLKPALSALHKRGMAAAGNSAGVLTTPVYPEATLHYALAGSVTLTLNALSDTLEVDYAGRGTQQLVQPDSSLSLATEYGGVNRCEVKLQRTLSALLRQLWDMQGLFTAERAAEHLRELKCELPGSITTNTLSGERISSLAPSRLLVTNVPVAEQSHGMVSLQLGEYEITQAGDEALNRLRRALTPVEAPFAPMAMSPYGKQSLALEMALELPKNMQAPQGKPFKIEVKQFTFSSAASHTEGSGLFALTPQGEQQQGEFAWRATAEFTPQQTAIVRANMGRVLHEAMSNEQFAAVAGTDSARLEAAMFDALPDVTMLGKITQNIALRFSFAKEKKTGKVELSALEIGARDYGLSGSGQASVDEGQMLPALHADLTCRNCIAMVDALAAYLVRVEAAAILLSPQNAGKIAFDPQQVQGIRQLLQAVGTPSASDLRFVIESKDGAVNINGKTLPELLQLVQQYLGKPTPPAK